MLLSSASRATTFDTISHGTVNVRNMVEHDNIYLERMIQEGSSPNKAK
jgi:hypothetical protein